jgi:hypothetical protein
MTDPGLPPTPSAPKLADPTKIVTEPLAPVAVAIIGMPSPPGVDPPATGSIIQTPAHQPNYILTVIPPLLAIFVRFANAYLTTLVGLVGVGMTSNALPAADFAHLVLKCAGLSVAGAGFGLLKDLITVFGRLEGKYPLLTGSV